MAKSTPIERALLGGNYFEYTTDPEKIPSHITKLFDPCGENGPGVIYACPDSCWKDHFAAWCKERRNGNKLAPEPMSKGHCMFERPASYGRIPYAKRHDKKLIRDAWEHRVRADLDGWDRDLTKEQLDKIVKATVDAKMKGVDTGGAPFVACIYAGLNL